MKLHREQRAPTPSVSASADAGGPAADSVDAPVTGYVAVPLEILRGDEPFEFALHRKLADSSIASWHAAGQTLTDADRTGLTNAGERMLYVRNHDCPAYRRRIEGSLADLLADRSVWRRHQLACDIVVGLIDEILQSPQPDQCERASRVAGQIANVFASRAEEIESMLALRPDDYHTAWHMLSVSLMMLALGREVELDPSHWPAIALGGLLHDVGKMGMPESLLQKEGRLQEAEWQFIQAHPLRGAEWLNQSPILSPVVRQVALLHHEQPDRAACPQAGAPELVNQAVRMCAIVNTWDRLTTARPYRPALPPMDALRVMQADCRQTDRFDAALLAAWRRTVGRLWLGEDAEPADPDKPWRESPAALPLESFLPLPPMSGSGLELRTPRRDSRSSRKDRRNQQRYRYNTACRVRFIHTMRPDGHIPFWVTTADLSRGGMRILHDQAMHIGETVEIFVPAASRSQPGRRFLAQICHCRRGGDAIYYVGLKFEKAI